jgi:hypothetical protein
MAGGCGVKRSFHAGKSDQPAHRENHRRATPSAEISSAIRMALLWSHEDWRVSTIHDTQTICDYWSAGFSRSPNFLIKLVRTMGQL